MYEETHDKRQLEPYIEKWLETYIRNNFWYVTIYLLCDINWWYIECIVWAPDVNSKLIFFDTIVATLQ